MSKYNLEFNMLRAANLDRLPLFKNAKGEPAHATPDGRDWSPAEWMCALTGEVGELANLIKKVRRGDLTHAEAYQNMRDELGDIQTYLDLLAYQLQINLGDATAEKFNKVSRRVGCKVLL